MKHLITFLTLLFIFSDSRAQNMVPNGDFESYIGCPTSVGQIDSCSGWRRYNQGTSDYFNACANSFGSGSGVPASSGNLRAASGNAHAGLITYFATSSGIIIAKEYLARQITALTPGYMYEVSMSVSLAWYCGWATDDLGVWFYDDGPTTTISSIGVVRANPQITYGSYGVITDTGSWKRISSVFFADSAYDNIVIGGFTDPSIMTATAMGGISGTAYYFIDSVIINRANNISININDSLLCTGDTLSVAYSLYPAGSNSSSTIYLLQLSDTSGSFNNAITLDTITGIDDSTLKYPIPSSIISSNNYKVRVITSNAIDTSNIINNISIGAVAVNKPVITTNSPVCIGDTLTLSVSGNISGVSYKWKGPNGFSSTIQSPPSINSLLLAGKGEYEVTATLYGCINKDTASVSLIRTDSLLAYATGIVCQTDTIKLSAFIPGTPVSVSWTGINSFIAQRADTFIAMASTNRTGDYIFSANYGSCIVKDTVSILVKPLPTSFTTSSNSPICDNTNLNLSATTASSGVSYSWSGPNSFTSTAASPVISPASLAANGDYYITATLNGCSIKDTVSVQITPIPGRPITTANSPVCIGQSIHLTANSINGTTYFWEGPGRFNVITQNPTLSNASLGMAGRYRVRAVTNACTSVEDTINVVVIAAPSVGIYPSPKDSICQGSPISFVGTPTNGGISPQYQWYRNGVAVPGATTRTPSITPVNDKDIFYCIMTTTGVCADPFTDTSNAIPITVMPWLAPSVTIMANPNTPVVGGQMINFTATPVDAGKAPTYQWKRNGSDVIGAVSNIWGANNLDNNDTICVIVKSSYQCPMPATAKSNCIVVQINTTGITHTQLLDNISIYPNPVTNELTIEGIKPKTTIQLFDVVGKIVYSGIATTDKETINTSALPTGTYLLQLVQPDGRKLTAKITKQ